MSTPSSDATTPVPVVASPPVDAADEVGERGRLDIAFGVVRRIAEHAADSTEGTVRTERRVAGLGFGEAGSSAKVSGYGGQVDLRLEVPLAYPAPIALTVEAVRGNVRDRIQTLTGYAVRSLDVTVSALSIPSGPPAPTSRVQ
ncbi:Asp23/Gls24 family envelope stress response protein [Actinomycetospora chiangmaiensis]|uniref:Asp23/Gls24 family envelope stress response protein n=1 Tax=Actinomycetospora chiangmaiensis TaxID=402650 RepID=UPI0003730A3C|nr:Asp23/Gls24 family envelope stress response protein [Actinomycetospora chiangmaiensis]